MRTHVLITVLAVLAIMAVGGVLLNRPLYSKSSPSIRISSPPPNSLIVAGQTVSVTIQPGPATSLKEASAWFIPPTAVPQVVKTAPFTVSVTAPTGVSGPVTLTGAAIDASGNRLQASIQVVVMSAS